MNRRLSLVLYALAVLPLAALASGPASTLDPVTAAAPVPELRVSCAQPFWPQPHQIQRYTHADAATSLRLREQVRREGRAVCREGYTHVQVRFSAAPDAVALAGR
ncbi:hypothetical protein [Lysobacter solisilvae (ex Woo and Kim 2020)]|uniref:Uncharacterized protein n=1 Tax=Agrilutibacter terrestris TaxID=2865112 RepID=A0A7H0G100_9GAMM|nr:hypothetical protein [Lysobacter terrestris]QNP41966.1 hypothetical protein H8B22_07170 [Lysobacter terrestris]